MLTNGTICEFIAHGKRFNFFVSNPDDLIQKHHIRGKLYETEELEIIKKNIGFNSICYDVGANIGNHAVFMAQVLEARKVYVFEVNPPTCHLLKINVLLNSLSDIIDCSYLGIGAGYKIGSFILKNSQVNNIGATRLEKNKEKNQINLKSDDNFEVYVTPLDFLNIQTPPDFVKIDVEGMEIDVLRGMNNLINCFKPKIFIEVDNKNIALFKSWLEQNDYSIIESYKRYEANENFFIAPRN